MLNPAMTARLDQSATSWARCGFGIGGWSTLTVQAGETIDFRFTNTGKVAHDAFIGDNAAQMDHEAEMGQMGGTDDHATEEEALVLQPGESGELTYTFDKAGTFEVGCHQPGHYAAGMKIDVTVE
jgi:uncharacterized cupredoxin-like copper-binding protein